MLEFLICEKWAICSQAKVKLKLGNSHLVGELGINLGFLRNCPPTPPLG